MELVLLTLGETKWYKIMKSYKHEVVRGLRGLFSPAFLQGQLEQDPQLGLEYLQG